ncbi:trichohyalin isoform X3 [Takifugu flavidus]|uniref:trichohyalin isoform X3 n=1 Tax=Takifugu flavidus TaxID=433684 RepID=UPI0025442BDD|nr:trichohyalin isoform X3 [Takifugu flavidus]XP_056897937.1 trichohyalin isoform X3 [Takifugu flavidus]
MHLLINMQTVLGQISMRLLDNGLPAKASVEEQLLHLWQQLLNTENKLHSTTEELETLRAQQAKEMEEVESYVAHIRGLLEEREGLTAEYEKDNEHLRQELHQIRQQQESESKELEEMLAQEDLGEMGLNSPGEQVAYLLVERATLLERLEAVEMRLESRSIAEKEDAQLEPVCHTRIEELRQAGKDEHKTVDYVSKSSSQSPLKKLFGLRKSRQRKHITPAHSEISLEKNERQWLERDLEEASRRLAMAHQDIRRLTNELDAAKNNNLEPSDLIKLQRAKEQNEKLDAENRGLRERIHLLEAQNKKILVQLAIHDAEQDAAKEQQKDKNISGDVQNENDTIHKRCLEAMEDGFVQVRELQRQLQRLRKDQGELEERNEELEALLGEAQNASKEDRHRHEAELEGLHRRIKVLEAELKKQDAQDKMMTNREEVKHPESYLQLQHLRDSSQERLALLEARLTEEQDWRKQLEADLSAAQTALRKDKEALQIGERELKKLRLEVKSLQTECQQGKTLIKSLTQVKAEKAALEEKLNELQKSQNQLQSEQGHKSPGSKSTSGNSKDDSLDQQRDDRVFEGLQKAHLVLRSELVSEREQTAELQAKLSSCLQEKLTAERKIEALELEKRSFNEYQKQYQEQNSVKDEIFSCQKPEQPHKLSIISEDTSHYCDQVATLTVKLKHMETELVKEQETVSQLELSLQAEASESQALKRDLQKSQSLLASAQAELHHIKEKNVDLKRCNVLLEQEALKAESKLHSLVSKCEQQQQNIRELEVELADSLTKPSSLQEELQSERAKLAAANKKVSHLKQELEQKETKLVEEQEKNSQEKSVLQAQASEGREYVKELQKSQSLLTSAETELHHVKEMNVDLKRHNTLLEQEKLKLSAELKQAQTKLHQAEETIHSHLSQCEHQRQKIRELEAELADNSTKRSLIGSLQVELQTERGQLTAANKKVFELQQQLSRVELQLHEQEVLVQKINNLERNNRDLSDTLSVLREKHHEEKTTRTLLEKRVEELQQQVTTLKVKEATLTQNNAEVNQLFQELNARQTDVEAESRRTKEEVKTSQELNHKLKEDLLHSRREYNRIHSKYMEKQIQAKTMLHQTKQKFFKETAQRNSVIQKLEKEAKRLICTLAEERDKFLEERRELLQKITKLEEEGARTTSAVQHRVNMLEEEKRLLHHQIQMLSRQNCSLESALRKSGSTLENTKTNNGSIEGLLSASLRLPSYVDNLDKCHVKVIEHAVMNSTQLSVSTLQRSEQGYLNLTMPSVPPEPGDK